MLTECAKDVENSKEENTVPPSAPLCDEPLDSSDDDEQSGNNHKKFSHWTAVFVISALRSQYKHVQRG